MCFQCTGVISKVFLLLHSVLSCNSLIHFIQLNLTYSILSSHDTVGHPLVHTTCIILEHTLLVIPLSSILTLTKPPRPPSATTHFIPSLFLRYYVHSCYIQPLSHYYLKIINTLLRRWRLWCQDVSEGWL